ncbi:uncharacterized protein LOC131622823 [Vicia villosa]|uniref:uncharacterized protein LOC131622823 n=1 Tax=Vicia villosa TaxID=3911 RepID=UPI00273BF222|nr:uncharacterized protein LOC131622823 [Vicia villosa]
METRCDPLKIKKAILKLGFDNMEFTENRGFAGGIVVDWKRSEINIQVSLKNNQFIHAKVCMENVDEWWFTAIYASPNDNSKKLLWEELKNIAKDMKDVWMLAGDFNDIASSSEKKGGLLASTHKYQRKKEGMNDSMVSNLDSKEPMFTWRGPIFHGGQRIYEKLDRAINNDGWTLHFLEAFVKVLTRVEFFDHHPILINLREDMQNYQKRPFHFESAWLINDTYKNMLQESWDKDHYILHNLRNVVTSIDKWKFETFDQVKRQKNGILRRLNGIQNKL